MKIEPIQGTANLFDRHTQPRDFTKFRTPTSVKKSIYEASVSTKGTKVSKVDMFVTVKSNYARDRVVVLGNGDLILNFDRNGIATIPAHKAYLLEPEMRARPGRYTVIQQESAETVPEVAVVPVVEVAPEVTESTDDEEVVVDVSTEEVPETRKIAVVKPKGKKISKEND